MSHEHIVYDSDPHFTIDADTRKLNYTSPDKLTIMQGDHNSEIVTFDMPRYIDGHDMSLCNKVQVHFINIDGNNANTRIASFYTVTDLHISEIDENILVFSWAVSKDATTYVGNLNFALRFACMSGSRIEYLWHSSVYSGIRISDSINAAEAIVDEYIEVLQEWYYELLSAGSMGVNVVNEATEEALSKIALAGGAIVSDTEPTDPNVRIWVKPYDASGYNLWVRNVSTGVFEPIVSIMASTGEVINVVHGTGDSTTAVMSQAAVTSILDSYKALIDENTDKLSYGQDLAYELYHNGEGYIVTGLAHYFRTPTAHFVIPETYQGLPVIGISPSFNFGVSTFPESIRSVVIPASVKYFVLPDGSATEDNVFSHMYNLKVINLLAHDTLPKMDFTGCNLAEASSKCKIYVKRAAYESAIAGDNYVPGWDVMVAEMRNKIVLVD